MQSGKDKLSKKNLEWKNKFVYTTCIARRLVSAHLDVIAIISIVLWGFGKLTDRRTDTPYYSFANKSLEIVRLTVPVCRERTRKKDNKIKQQIRSMLNVVRGRDRP